MSQIRDLVNFFGDIQNCKTKEEERSRVDKEIAKIPPRSLSNTKYTKKQCSLWIWKILYMYTLGYAVEFGHMHCVDLIRSDIYSEKNIGYIGISTLLIEYTDMLRMSLGSIRKDLNSRNEIFQCLALTCVANVGGPVFAEATTPDVQSLLISGSSGNFVRKKSALCLLRFIRQYPDYCPSPQIAPQIIKLAEHRNIGVVTSILSLLTGLATYDTESYVSIIPVAIRLLHQFVINRECNREYIYNGTPCPWLQVKLLRILQYYPPPTNKNLLNKLHVILEHIVTKTELTQSVNTNYADHSILVEAINVIIHLNLHGNDMLHDRAICSLLHYINNLQYEMRYIGMCAMARLAKITSTHKLIKRHSRTIQYSLYDSDPNIRDSAFDLLCIICDEDNVVEIIEYLLRYLTKAEYEIKGELVFKIAILAEKYVTDYQWYFDVVLNLLTNAGDFVSDDLGHRVINIITNDETLQLFAAEKAWKCLKSRVIHESMIKVVGYILGEFGHLIESKISVIQQFEALYECFPCCSPDTKALLLSTFMKFMVLYDGVIDLQQRILSIFKNHRNAIELEIQSRSLEYSAMAQHQDQELITRVWKVDDKKHNDQQYTFDDINDNDDFFAQNAGFGDDVENDWVTFDENDQWDIGQYMTPISKDEFNNLADEIKQNEAKDETKSLVPKARMNEHTVYNPSKMGDQLRMFGYNEMDINDALKNVVNKNDINKNKSNAMLSDDPLAELMKDIDINPNIYGMNENYNNNGDDEKKQKKQNKKSEKNIQINYGNDPNVNFIDSMNKNDNNNEDDEKKKETENIEQHEKSPKNGPTEQVYDFLKL